MTRERTHGTDSVFNAWLRSTPRIHGSGDGMVITDIDAVIHRYGYKIDGTMDRTQQYVMMIEVKNSEEAIRVKAKAQQDTLYKLHYGTCGFFNVGANAIRHFGVAYAVVPNDDPEECDALGQTMRWGRFDHSGKLNFRDVDITTLAKLINFDIHPDTLKPLDDSHEWN